MKYLFAAITIFFLGACTSPKKALMQTWRITNVVFLDSLNTVTQKQKDLFTYKLMGDVQFTFLKDSAYQVHNGSEVVNGKWWFSGNKKMLFTTTPQVTVQSKIYQLDMKGFKFESAGDLGPDIVFTCVPAATDKK